MLGMVLHVEGRISRLEQSIVDSAQKLSDLQSQVNKLDDKLDQWQRTRR
jgi:cell division protein FtsL